jgi:hypothetical protein
MNIGTLIDLLKSYNVSLPVSGALGSFLAPAFLGARAGQSLNHLTVCVEELSELVLPASDPDVFITAANRIGKPADPSTPFCFTTRAGWLNANPAMICLFPETGNGKLTIAAFAKEGLISQKTAAKAISRYKTALADSGVTFAAKTRLPLTRMDRAAG